MAKRGDTVRVKVSDIRRLARLQCTEAEAAAELGLSKKNFASIIKTDERAREAWEFGKAIGRVRIRAQQDKLADRYPQMAIFLGKQYLGQNEVSVVEHSGRDGGPIKTLDLTKLDAKQRADLRTLLTTARVKRDA